MERKVYIGADHAGFEMKEKIKEYLLGKEYQVEDCGPMELDSQDDYPDFTSKVGEMVSRDKESKGIVLGGSGTGETIAASRYPGIRAVTFYGKTSKDPYGIVKLSRQHNDANILSLGARFLTDEDALEAVQIWLDTPFSNDERHVRRLNKIREIEEKLYK